MNFASSRIGHYVADSIDFSIRKKHILNDKILYLIYQDNFVSNKFWEILCKKHFNISWVYKYIAKWNKIIPGGECHQYKDRENPNSRDIEGMIFKYGHPFKIDENLIKKGYMWLRSIGWKENQPYICLLVRDSEYLKKEPSLKPKDYLKKDWDYHNFRDADINTYIKSIKWLISQGVFVIRMGKIMKIPLDIKSPHYYDYAFSKHKSDFLDVFLFSNCTATISTMTGIDYIPAVFQKPILFNNYLPTYHTTFYNLSMSAPKKIFSLSKSRLFNLKETLNISYDYLNGLEGTSNSKIKIINLDSKELLSIVKEFWLWVETGLKVSETEKKQNEDMLKFILKYSQSTNEIETFKDKKIFVHPQWKISQEFLKLIDLK